MTSIIFIFIKINSNKKNIDNIKPPVNISNEIATFKDIAPGNTYKEEYINKMLGIPVSSTLSGEVKINNYSSSNEYRTNDVEFVNGEVDFIKEVVNLDDTRTAEDIRKVYGVTEYVLYENVSDSYFNLYVYPKNGIAYLGHNDGTVLEIWYFKPTDINTFKSKWASNYSNKPFTGQTGH
jgi:hypothetical protein